MYFVELGDSLLDHAVSLGLTSALLGKHEQLWNLSGLNSGYGAQEVVILPFRGATGTGNVLLNGLTYSAH